MSADLTAENGRPDLRMRKFTSFLVASAAALAAALAPAAAETVRLQPAQLEAPTRRAPSDAAEMKASFAPVVRQTAPAVVNISARRVVRQRDPFWELFGGGAPRARVDQSVGSGVIVRSDGVVITNNHVIEGAQELRVTLADRREYSARVLLADARLDLAVLQLDVGGDRLPVLAIDSGDDLEVGDLVLAIGNPFGVGQTVTNGIVSAINRTPSTDGTAFIQTDAAINPGNSGGALVDMDGDLIGINSFILSRSGTSSGVGFAVPGAVVRRVVETALGGGQRVIRPWLGADGEGVTSEVARSLGLDRPRGVLITDLWPDGPGERAGLRRGDVLLSVDGAPVNAEGELNYRIATKRPGETATLEVLRAGRRETLRARVEAPSSTPPRDERALTGPMTGAVVVNFTPALAEELGVDPFAGRGVLISRVSGRAYAAQAGFRPGDFVREVNGRPIQTTAQLDAALKGAQSWTIVIERNGQRITGRF
jgi:Do/DeqQ family serine protease